MILERPAALLLLLIAGFVVWSSAFLWLYGGLSVGCAFGWETVVFGPASLLRALLVALWLAHLALVALLLLAARRRLARAGGAASLEGFLARAVVFASLVALAITAINYAPILGLTLCL